MCEKVYYNEKLEKMLNRYVKEEKYGGFKPLLHEIFQRRVYEFQFNEKQMKKQIKNFVNKVDSIKFGINIPKAKKSNLAFYRFVKGSKGIYFNCEHNFLKHCDFSDIDFLYMYEFLTHEVYHAISHYIFPYSINCGLHEKSIVYNKIIEKGILYNEIINETAATRTTFSRTKEDDENFRQQTIEYQSITFIANLLAASLGVEERDLVKGGLQNREEFEKAIQKYISEEDYDNDILSHCDILEANLDILYNALYSKKKSEMDSKVVSSSLKQIYSQIYNIASISVSKSTREIDKEYAEELAYNFQKIQALIGKSLAHFVKNDDITKDTADEILKDSFYNSIEYLYKVSDIIMVTNYKSLINKNLPLEEMEELAKEGKLIENVDELTMKGGKNATNRYKLIKCHKKTNKEFENPTQWDNKSVIEIMKQLWNQREVIDVEKVEQEIASKRISKKILDLITRVKNRKLKKLEVPKQSCRELENNLDEKYQISFKDLKPIEKNKKTKNYLKNEETKEKM